MVFDPHAIKIHVDGSCSDNPGGNGGFAVRVDWGCDIDREPEVVEYQGYFGTNNQRMELRGCIAAHQCAWDRADSLRGRRVIVLTDSKYVYESYSWVVAWAQNDYCNSDGRPMKNDDLFRELMTLRRKLSRCLRIEVRLIPRRSDDGAKEVDRIAKTAGQMPAHVDWGFRSGKVGRSRNNSGKAGKLYPAAGQEIVVLIYHSVGAGKGVQLFKFQEFDEVRKDFFEKFQAYACPEIGNNLRRGNAYRIRMNDLPRYPQIVEIVEELGHATDAIGVLTGVTVER